MSDLLLSDRQLMLVAHVANGYNYTEIAAATFLSESSVKQTIKRAQVAAEAKTLPHLVSIVIASGLLVWSDEDRERQVGGEVSPE